MAAFVLTSTGVYPDEVNVYGTDGDRPVLIHCPTVNVTVHLSVPQARGLLAKLEKKLNSEGAVT